MRRTSTRLRGFVAALLMAGAFLASAAPPDLLPASRAFQLSGRLEQDRATLRYRIAEGYYLYRDKLRFSMEPAAAAAGTPILPRGRIKHDEFFGRVETYRGEVVIHLPVRPRGPQGQVVVTAIAQGCADVGVCYPPHQDTLVLVAGQPETGAMPQARGGTKSLLDALDGKP